MLVGCHERQPESSRAPLRSNVTPDPHRPVRYGVNLAVVDQKRCVWNLQNLSSGSRLWAEFPHCNLLPLKLELLLILAFHEFATTFRIPD